MPDSALGYVPPPFKLALCDTRLMLDGLSSLKILPESLLCSCFSGLTVGVLCASDTGEESLAVAELNVRGIWIAQALAETGMRCVRCRLLWLQPLQSHIERGVCLLSASV